MFYKISEDIWKFRNGWEIVVMCRIDVTGENVNIRMNKELNVRIEVKRTKKQFKLKCKN